MRKPRDISRNTSNPLSPVDRRIEQYQNSLLSKHDDQVLLEMERLAAENNFPIVGRIVGAFLEVLALSIKARSVFEFGSGFGYSAYWFSRAVGQEGKVICTDGEGKNAELAENFLSRCGRWQRVHYRVGWAQETFEASTDSFDLIYNDVDKDAYPEIWRISKDRIRPGGLYIADNVLWGGRVALPAPREDPFPGWTEAIEDHNSMIAADPDFDFFINPSRDGVIVARRKS